MTRTFKTKAEGWRLFARGQYGFYLNMMDHSVLDINSFKLEHCGNGDCLQGVAFRKYWLQQNIVPRIMRPETWAKSCLKTNTLVLWSKKPLAWIMFLQNMFHYLMSGWWGNLRLESTGYDDSDGSNCTRWGDDTGQRLRCSITIGDTAVSDCSNCILQNSNRHQMVDISPQRLIVKITAQSKQINWGC